VPVPTTPTQDQTRQRPRGGPAATAVYVSIVYAVGAGVLALALIDQGFRWLSRDPIHLALLALATIVTELKPVRMPHGTETEDVTVSTTFAYALVLGWGGLAGALALILAAAITGFATRRETWKVAFNVAQYTISILAAGVVYEALSPFAASGAAPLPPRTLPFALIGGLTFFIFNNTLVATALAMSQGRSIIEVNTESIGFQAGLAGALVALSPIVLVLITWSPWVFPLLMLPLLTIISGGRAVAERTRDEDRYRALARHAADLVVIVDEDLTFRYVSPSVEAILGHQTTYLLGRSLFDIVHPQETARARAVLDDLLAHPGKVVTGEFLARGVDGGLRHFEATFNNLLEDVSVRGVVVNARDITERKVLEQELAHQAFHDSLTKLANRALFLDRVQHALRRSDRADSPTSVLFVDVDDFKTINDSLGHPAGDQVLIELAARVRSCLRPEDTVARLGGDEFAVLLEDSDASDAVAAASRILAVASTEMNIQRHPIVIQASIGVAVSQGSGSAEELLRDADVAMYAAKALGKGQYVVFEPEMHQAALARIELRADLQRAIEAGELFLHYQPIVSLEKMRISGVEALVRWQHPRRGVLAPGAFIPLAEETGLIDPLGRWVLVEACRQAKVWAKERRGLTVSVNLSARQLQRPDFVDDVAELLRDTKLDPSLLVLEITESVLMRDAEESVERLRSLNDLGVRLAIDDFGTGYSSLSYLKRFPVDILKIDRSFVEGLARGAEESALARAIVQIGRSLRLRTVAEGIEDADQLARLRDIGCDFGQGYFLATPVPAYEISAMLGDGRFVAGEQPRPPARTSLAGIRTL
jgi:diguanylate cyclase (GGDEF)-like protein/PAS domain S-box-containing protein